MVAVTPMAGRSGVCGGSIPSTAVSRLTSPAQRLVHVDEVSMTADVRAGTFGPDLERRSAKSAPRTPGHWPQSMDLSTVGGWLACRGAGQYSTRYGKIEDMVIGLEVVLPMAASCTPKARVPGPPPAQPDPALRGQRGHARRHYRSPLPHPPDAAGSGASCFWLRFI